ncbi:MAG TPA: acyl-CoA dehydrogenase [Planctomycetes bacterium]|nr:acyl-CoA dehydrogenase [Planctomycetota bacterium]
MFLVAAILVGLTLFFLGRTWLGWILPLFVLLLGLWRVSGGGSPGAGLVFLGLFLVALAAITGLRPLRQAFVTRHLLPLIKPILPRMSETERIAIEAGTVWWEAEFFTGAPNWNRLHGISPAKLTDEEQAFLDGPCERVCQMVTDWETNRAGDLPGEVWELLKHEGFFGMIIPKEYGGLGFSAVAHSAVVAKLSSRSVPLCVTVMVPNSLGPAELLLHYGTKEQKDHYLPRLATGEEVPCFALTEPGAGSDAGSMTSEGIVCKGTFEGEEVLGMRLTWNKRYITLAPVATVLGLAFKLRDPDGLLGDRKELGITCALIPTNLPGVEVGERHDPMGSAFMNGPTHGKDIFVPLDFIIGGRKNAGRGWLMLMQSLSAGRGVSLPSMASGAVQLAVRTTGAYATVRKQFGMPIGRFEGIAEPLARIAGRAYMMEGARRMTAAAVDMGEKPAVASAIVKCYLTEAMRKSTNDAMDIVGGAGISMGPRNVLASGYTALPIAITVEGANILTRSMILFGQGAIRCHPFVQDEMRGAFEDDVPLFDRAFFGHVGFVVQSAVRSLVLGLTNGALATAPPGVAAPYYRRLTRASASFALLGDVAMGTLGGSLKRKETITGRLADALAWMYLASASLKRFHDEGSPAADVDVMRWSVEDALYRVEIALDGVLRNLPARWVARLLRPVIFPLGRRSAPPSDHLGAKVARALVEGGELRERLTTSMYVPADGEAGLGFLEETLGKILAAKDAWSKIHAATRAKELDRKPKATLVERAAEAGIISAEERARIEAAEAARGEAVQVDSFDAGKLARKRA